MLICLIAVNVLACFDLAARILPTVLSVLICFPAFILLVIHADLIVPVGSTVLILPLGLTVLTVLIGPTILIVPVGSAV